MINGYATVIMADVAAGNSLVHVINKVGQYTCCN